MSVRTGVVGKGAGRNENGLSGGCGVRDDIVVRLGSVVTTVQVPFARLGHSERSIIGNVVVGAEYVGSAGACVVDTCVEIGDGREVTNACC